MRGGSIPIAAWALLLAVLMSVNWIWTNDTIQVGSFGFAVGIILLSALALVARDGESARRGPPTVPREPEAVPTASIGAMLAGLSVGAIMFGFAFGHFFVFFGAGVLAASLGRIAIEVRDERRARRAAIRRSYER